MGVGDQRNAPAALPPGMTRYPLYGRLGGPQSRDSRIIENTVFKMVTAITLLTAVSPARCKYMCDKRTN